MNRNVLPGEATRADDQNYSIKKVIDANYAILRTDYFDEIWSAPSTVDRTVTFPNPALAINLYRKIKIKNDGTGTYKVTLLPFASETFNVMSGNEEWTLSSFELLQSGDWCEYIGNGTNWIKCNEPYWHLFNNPATGTKIPKTSGWTADQFTPGGLEVTFSELPIGSTANRAVISQFTTPGNVFWRKSGDTNISNTPVTDSEYSHRILSALEGITIAELWMSNDLKVEIAVSNTLIDLNIYYAIQYLQ